MGELRKIVQGTLLENEPMSNHTSYGIGGPADAYITPKDRYDLAEILKFAKKYSIQTHFVGSGSNLLVADSGIDGIVLTPAKALTQLEFNDGHVIAESGVMLGRLVKECNKRNLTGVESMIGVPGTLGGALVMNAGAFGGEISNYLHSVEIMNMSGEIKTYYPGDIDFAYRFSTLRTDEFVLLARFNLEEEDSIIIQEKRNKASKGRKTNQPLKFRSAGSVFKNPKENAAGYLIDQAGLKGTQVGDAEISEHHANFFVNHGKAKASDITKLIRIARKSVFKKFGIKLELEVKTIGFDPKEFGI
jgi:UDP-N-acetylmuramate dehydrogenase|tara:strand:+ start:44 stop:952 length:909 start_codon:yes stop_codon:yes gene_type:complete